MWAEPHSGHSLQHVRCWRLISGCERSLRIILHAVRNDAVDFLAIVPSPPQLIFQRCTFSTGGEGKGEGEGEESTVFWFIILTPRQPPHPACRPLSPPLPGEIVQLLSRGIY